MKITSNIEIADYHLSIEPLHLKKPYTIAYTTISEVNCVLLILRSSDGLSGFGSASPAFMVTGEKVEESFHQIKQWVEANLLRQKLEPLFPKLSLLANDLAGYPAAAAAVDMALYDLYARKLNLPLCAIWGQKLPSLPTSVTVGIPENITAGLTEIKEYFALGFRYFKLKTGLDVQDDVEIIKAVRKEMGPEIHLRVDVNQGYQIGDLKTFLAATADCNLELVEQPFAKSDLESIRKLPAEWRQKVAADESIISVKDAFYWSGQAKGYGIFNIKLMKSGGIFNAMQIANLARLAGIQLMWGCNDESKISISAALHAALSCDNTKYLDLDGNIEIARKLVRGGYRLKNGQLSILSSAGLGVELKEVLSD